MAALFLDEIHAQSRSIGATFSIAGTGLEFVQTIDSRHSAQYQMRMETANMFLSTRGKAGISASAFWNTVISQIQSRNNNTIQFYAGPGICIGYSGDRKNHPTGMILGLKGRIGAECCFERGVTVSMSISPMLGGHFSRKDSMVNMRLYRLGLLYGIMPEVGIRHNF